MSINTFTWQGIRRSSLDSTCREEAMVRCENKTCETGKPADIYVPVPVLGSTTTEVKKVPMCARCARPFLMSVLGPPGNGSGGERSDESSFQ